MNMYLGVGDTDMVDKSWLNFRSILYIIYQFEHNLLSTSLLHALISASQWCSTNILEQLSAICQLSE